MRILFIFLLSFNLFTVSVFASDVQSDYDNSFTLYDVVVTGKYDNNIVQFFQDPVTGEVSVDYFVKESVYPLVSAIVACSPTCLDDIVSAILTSDVFLRHVIFNPISRTINYEKEALDAIEQATIPLIYDTVSVGAPEGFYPCLYSNYWHAVFGGTDNYYYWFVSDLSDAQVGTNTYFANVNGYALFCSFASDGLSIFTVDARVKSTPPNQNSDGSLAVTNLPCDKIYTVNDKKYLYGYRGIGGIGLIGDFNSKYPVVYSSFDDALKAFYGFTPHDDKVLNGSGFIRPVDKKTYTITKYNVVNNNWENIINKNYTEFGSNFSTTIFNSFQYIQPVSDTPDYIYNQYTDDIVYPTITYNLDDITLSDPSFTTDNTFVTGIFDSFPVLLTGFFVSVFALSSIILFLRS